MNLIPTRRKATPSPDTDAPVLVHFDGLAMLREIHPDYARLSDRFAALVAREEDLQTALAGPAEASRRFNTEAERAGRAAAAARPPAPPPQHNAAAIALLSDVLELEPPPAPPPPFAAKRPDEELADRLSAELAAVREAVGLLRPRLEAAHLVASRLLCDRLIPDYRRVAGRYVAALVELGLATEAYDAFTHSVRNVAWSLLRPIAVSRALGKPTEKNSEFGRLFAFAVETGHISVDQIPDEFRGKRNNRAAPAAPISKVTNNET